MSIRQRFRVTPGHQAGFTLLEALITVVVVSIGLLGILGLQTVSIANTQISAARSIASFAADNMADRIRANSSDAAGDKYAQISPDTTKPANCAQKTCSPGDLADFDGWEWNTSLERQLPDGRGYVDCDSATSGRCQIYRITVVWHERDMNKGSGAAPAKCTDSDFTDRCFETLVRP